MRGGVLFNRSNPLHYRPMDLLQLSHRLTVLATDVAQRAGQRPDLSASELNAPELLHAQSLCLQLLNQLSAQAEHLSDPRAALAYAHFAQAFSYQATRSNIIAASLVETTDAHGLDLDEFDELHAGRTDFSAEPRFAAGRTVYQDAASVLSNLLDMNYFEAARRVKDAHLIHARRDQNSVPCAPRFRLLAEHFATGVLPSPEDAATTDDSASSSDSASAPWNPPDLHYLRDPREVLKAARALDSFEPEDTTFDGLPTTATATGPDGMLLEEHASEMLHEPSVRSRQKHLNTLIKDYKDLHQEAQTPALGLFRGKVINGVHEFIVRVTSLDAELWNSLIAQADNKRTQAGAAARQTEQNTQPEASDQAEQSSAEADPQVDELWQSDQPIPEWARGAQTPPDLGTASDAALPARPTPTMPSTCTVAQRRMNALNAVLRNIDPENSTKRITPEIVVHASYQDLADLGSLRGVTAHGVKLSAGELRTMLCEAKVLSPIYNADGVIMDIGRDARLFPRWMKLAARDRDGGCLVPGCTEEPALLDYHHFKPWSKGGHTRLQDCCPLCRNHHVMVHNGYLRLVKVKGLPYVILPKHLDPDQQPRRNTYFSRAG